MIFAFDGHRSETKTMLPVTGKFMAAHQLPDVTVVADAGMISEANQRAIEAGGLSFILGMKIPDVPYVVDQRRREHPGEKSFRMPKSDLQTRPIYHRMSDSIEAHLAIVFATLAVGRWIESQVGWSIRKFIKTARRYRTIQIQAGRQTITVADPLPDDLRQAITRSNRGAY